MVKYNKKDILTRLRTVRDSHKYIVAAGAGSGISAKAIEQGGADLILVFNSGKYRMQGHGSLSGLLPNGNANDVALELGSTCVLPVIIKIPVICSCFAQDVTKVIENHLDYVMGYGFSGINNFPTIGLIDGDFRNQLEITGLGYEKEVEMIKLANKKNIFTIVYVFTAEQAISMIHAGADCIIIHLGLTTGGMVGSRNTKTISESVNYSKNIVRVGKAIKDDVLWLVHGGPLSTPQDFKEYINYNPDIDGFVGASSIERIPIEGAICNTVKIFKDISK